MRNSQDIHLKLLAYGYNRIIYIYILNIRKILIYKCRIKEIHIEFCVTKRVET